MNTKIKKQYGKIRQCHGKEGNQTSNHVIAMYKLGERGAVEK